MDHGPDSKRLRLSTLSWSGGPPPHGVALPSPHHSTPSAAYQPAHPSFPPRNPDHLPPHPPHPPPPQHSATAPPPPTSLPQPVTQAAAPTPLQQQQSAPQQQQQAHFEDRRHHEPEAYGPLPDPRQSSSAYSAYGQRDPPGIKRDPSDDTLPHMRRPHSTDNAADGTPVTPLGQPHPQQQQQQQPPPRHADERRHLSFDSGPGPSTMYDHSRQTSYPPPTPVSQVPAYDVHHHSSIYGAPTPSDIPYVATYPSSSKPQKKAQRASQACDSCRALKAKCDELKPCKNCKDKNVECKYRDPQPKQTDKLSSDILDAVMGLSEVVRAEFQSWHRWRRGLEQALKQSNPAYQPELALAEDEDVKTIARSRDDSAGSLRAGADDSSSSPADATMADTAGVHLSEHHQPHQQHHDSLDLRESSRDLHHAMAQMPDMDDLEVEPEPGGPVRPGEPKIPANHTTMAGHLLSWPAIKNLTQELLDANGVKYVGEFPIRQEEQRGLLRVYGRGEGTEYRQLERETEHYGPVDAMGGDDSSELGAGSPMDCWGNIGSMSPSSSVVDMTGKTSPPLDFTEAEVWKYVASFKDNIQNMHPLLTPKELDAMVRLFLETQTGNKQQQGRIARFVYPQGAFTATPNPSPHESTGSKRKRSPCADLPEAPTSSPQPSRPPRPQRTIQNAIVFLVLALGKICLWNQEKLPDVVSESDPLPQESPRVRNGMPTSPGQTSPTSVSGSHSHSSSAGFPSPKDIMDRSAPSRRSSSSVQGTNPLPPAPKPASTHRKKNYDVIPGLDFFAVATDIIGNQLGGTTLMHVHASIFAGLYHGQLGRVIESYNYIANASRVLYSVLRPHLDRLHNLQNSRRPPETKRDNQLVFAFWTLVQLESDILAELRLPRSELLSYEDHLPYPNLELAKSYGFEAAVVESYAAQLYLRRRLNDIHKAFYHPDKGVADEYPPSLETREHIQNFTESLRLDMEPGWMPKRYKFRPEDAPALDILAARLRAKWWGGNVIMYRPFVKQVFEFSLRYPAAFAAATAAPHAAGADSEQKAPAPGSFRALVLDAKGNTDAAAPAQETIHPRVLKWAERGVNALKESTRAFHEHARENPRFIVTNIFGTAHAQWGNLVTLAAAYRDPILSKFVDEGELRDLFTKTIAFFKLIAQPSSALYIDQKILEGIERRLWPMRGASMEDTNSGALAAAAASSDRRATSSFSSTTSSTTGGHRAPPVALAGLGSHTMQAYPGTPGGGLGTPISTHPTLPPVWESPGPPQFHPDM